MKNEYKTCKKKKQKGLMMNKLNVARYLTRASVRVGAGDCVALERACIAYIGRCKARRADVRAEKAIEMAAE